MSLNKYIVSGILMGSINSIFSTKETFTSTNVVISGVNLMLLCLINHKTPPNTLSDNSKMFIVTDFCTTAIGIVSKHLFQESLHTIYWKINEKISRADPITRAVWWILKTILFEHDR